MQKKIYSQFLVPCSLVLCLALGFLMSCGGDDGGTPDGSSSSAGGSKEPPPCTDCANPEVEITGLNFEISGSWQLTLFGSVIFEVPEGDPAQIKSIIIRMINKDIGGETVIMKKENQELGNFYNLSDVPPFDYSPCSINKYKQMIYIDVTPSRGGQKRDSLPLIDARPHQNCREFNLTTEVFPSGAGSVSVDPPGPYSSDKPGAKLEAKANDGYSFYNWTPSSGNCTNDGNKCDIVNPYSITITREMSLTANFVESRSLGSSQKVDLKEGQGGPRLGVVDNAVNLLSSGGDVMIQASNGVQLIEDFQSREYKLNEGPKKEIYDTDIPSPSNTNEFVTAGGSDKSSIEYSPGRYFVAKAGSGSADWFLLLAQPRSPDCRPTGNEKCVELTIWKVQ